MNKPLPATPREDDLVSSFDAFTLARKKPPVATPEEDDLVSSFDTLTLAGKKPPASNKRLPDTPSGRPAPQHTFVGGFSPGLLAPNLEPLPQSPQARNQHAKTATPPSGAKAPPELPLKRIPMPIPVPVPPAAKQSLTMQYALQPMGPDTPVKPMLSPALATPPQPDSDSILPPKGTSNPRLSLATAPVRPAPPVTPNRPRSISVTLRPVTSSPERSSAQCSGINKTGKQAGKQCSRKVKVPATHSHLDPIPVLYCFDHKEAVIATHGFYVRKVGIPEKFVEFSHYIPKYLQVETQLALKVEMEKATSAADVPGYIYTFEIRDPKRPDVIQLKVGRAVNLTKRLDQWDKQCGSKIQIPRGWWPGTIGYEDGAAGSLLKGNIKAGDPGPFCHRVERLVHIELTDLSLHAPYLNPSWPDNNNTSDRSPSASARNLSRRTSTCVDCGVIHREIFAFPRPAEGNYKGQEWDLIVKPVIEKWGRFVKEYYS